jgi:hypothetical protein
MRGIEHFNFPAFDAAAAYLRALGHDVVNPADLDRAQGFDGRGEVTDAQRRDMLRRDVWELAACDAIALLPGWQNSPGARFERSVAEETGIDIFHVVPWASFKAEAPTIIVGLSGYAQTGKDTSGAMMVEMAGFERLAFADALKSVALKANPLLPDRNDYLNHLHPLVQVLGWESVKADIPESRIFLQHLGAAVRDHVDPLAWVNAVLNKAQPGGRYCITDVRYPNEADAIKARGGFVVRVERPGTGPANAHVSETALDDFEFDAVLRNTGTLDDLKARVRIFLSTL